MIVACDVLFCLAVTATMTAIWLAPAEIIALAVKILTLLAVLAAALSVA